MINNFMYLHLFSREQCHLDAETYDQLVVQRKDSFGKHFGWNESVWIFAGALGQAYSQFTARRDSYALGGQVS